MEKSSVRDIEAIITELWCDLLGTEVSSDDNFFDVGGDSLLVVEVVVKTKARGIELKSTDVFKHPTPGRLAEAIADRAGESKLSDPVVLPSLLTTADELWRTHASPWSATAPRCMIPLATGGAVPPLFVPHWGDDAGWIWAAVRTWPDPGREIYGFEAPGFRSEVRPVVTIGEMAERFLAELLERQPHGPYFLAGFCHSAVVAFEMAQMLTTRAEKVALLAMVRPSTLEPFIGYGWGLDEIFRYRVESLAARFGLSGREDLEQVYARIREEGWYDDNIQPEDLPRLQMMWAALAWSLHHYYPKRYNGRVIVFQDVMDRKATTSNWSAAMPGADWHWFDHGSDSSRPIMTDPRVATVIRRELAEYSLASSLAGNSHL